MCSRRRICEERLFSFEKEGNPETEDERITVQQEENQQLKSFKLVHAMIALAFVMVLLYLCLNMGIIFNYSQFCVTHCLSNWFVISCLNNAAKYYNCFEAMRVKCEDN